LTAPDALRIRTPRLDASACGALRVQDRFVRIVPTPGGQLLYVRIANDEIPLRTDPETPENIPTQRLEIRGPVLRFDPVESPDVVCARPEDGPEEPFIRVFAGVTLRWPASTRSGPVRQATSAIAQ